MKDNFYHNSITPFVTKFEIEDSGGLFYNPMAEKNFSEFMSAYFSEMSNALIDFWI